MAENGKATRLVDELYGRHYALVLRRARCFFDGDDAQDLAHEVFVRVIEHIDGFRGASSPTTWLYAITTRVCLNRLRDDKRRKRLLADNFDAVPGTNSSMIDPAGLALLNQLWKTLDEDLAQVGVYFHVDGMTHEDIATLMGCSPSTVRNRLKAIEGHAQLTTEGTR